MTLGIITFIFGVVAILLNLVTMCITFCFHAELEREFMTIMSEKNAQGGNVR